jgi:hypothetical protein
MVWNKFNSVYIHMFVTAFAVIQEENAKTEYFVKSKIIIQIMKDNYKKINEIFTKKTAGLKKVEVRGNVSTLWCTLPNLVLIGCRFQDESN